MRAALLAVVACTSEPPPPPPPPPAPSPCTAAPSIRAGTATHYAADGTGACSFEREPAPLVAAVSPEDYAGAASCGSCLVVEGPEATELLVRVVDRCPACKPGELDLSREAFAWLAPLAKGRIPIRWMPVPCGVEGPLGFHFKPGSNPQWTAIQVRNHRYPIAALAVQTGKTFTPLARTDYNFFVGTALGAGPYTLRVTDARGQTHVETNVRGPEHAGAAQLPWCP